MAGFIGCGKLYYNRTIDGVSKGWVPFGNAMKFEISEQAEIKERSSKQCDSYGQTLDAVSIKGSTNLSFMLDDVDSDFDFSLLGLTSSISVAASTVTGEVAIATLGAAIQTANRKISSVVVKDQPGTTTYVSGTDYLVLNADVGLISILTGGGIANGDSIQVDYSFAAYSSTKVKGGTEASIKTALMLVGENLAKPGEGVIVNVWDATIKPTSGIDFLNSEFVNIEMDGVLVTDSAKGNAYEVETKYA